jgi:hypothetical protein
MRWRSLWEWRELGICWREDGPVYKAETHLVHGQVYMAETQLVYGQVYRAETHLVYGQVYKAETHLVHRQVYKAGMQLVVNKAETRLVTNSHLYLVTRSVLGKHPACRSPQTKPCHGPTSFHEPTSCRHLTRFHPPTCCHDLAQIPGRDRADDGRI